MKYTLVYTNDCGDTIARDYFDDIKEAEKFMDELIETYEKEGADTGLILEDSKGHYIRYYEPEYLDDEDFDDED
jgi:hypothetical protein